jgi:hypothetical protein
VKRPRRQTQAKSKRDSEAASYGAEAMPGGLGEINDSIRAQPDASGRIPPSLAKAPLVGLIALAVLWMRKNRDRS